MDRITNLKKYDESISPFGRDYNYDLEYLLNAIKKLDANYNKALITMAFKTCYNLHSEDKRASGVPNYVHSLSVALILVEEIEIYNTSMIISALLHDVIKDEVINYNIDDIERDFGTTVANLVVGITNIAHIGERTEVKKNKAETYLNFFTSIAKDIRVFVIKLCDRLHNIRTLQYLSPHKQINIAKETLNFYTPFAHKLGLIKIKKELENRSFYFYNYTQYNQIVEFLSVKKSIFTEYTYFFLDSIKTYLNKNGFPHTIKIMQMHEYEIFLMMQEGKKIDEIDNIFSLGIVLDSNDENDCYKANAVLVSNFATSDFVDLLEKPKIDWNRSLNNILYGPDGKVDITIRTKKMEELASQGLIKKIITSGSFRGFDLSEEDFELWENWMKYIIETKEDDASEIIWNSIKKNVYNEQINILSQNGEQILLPKGSTVIDLAFAISYETGLHTITSKVNGIIKDIFYELNDGEFVEIITSPKCYPDSNWQNHAITFKAICHLSNFFKTNYNLKEKKHKNDVEFFEYQILRVSGVENDGTLTKIKQIIGIENIQRITLASHINSFEAAIKTYKFTKDLNNSLFFNLIKVNGIKSISIHP